ncbi:MAG: hypothetical protein ACJA0U_000625 [Salibacteraceae bacterium]|jgi:hypothetical protein
MRRIILTLTACTLTLLSCTNSEPICECFETRLEIKELLSSSNGDYEKVTNSEEYKKLKEKKEECKTKIEPEYFQKNEIKRNGRSDKEFLMEELGGNCDAVKELFGEK